MSFDALKEFISQEMPVLDEQMRTLSPTEVLRVMNVITGRVITPDDGKTSTSVLFLDDLKAMKVRGTLNLSALPKGIAEVRKIQRER